MAHDLFNRYIWLADTLRRFGRITRAELDECWRQSPFSDGQPLPRRTFHNYREATERMFNIAIKCDPRTFEYYIDDSSGHDSDVADWLLNTAATNELLTKSRDVADRILVENVPSARDFLAPAIEALRQHRALRFDYLPYYRTIPSRGVTIEPYSLKLFRQRWYLTGRNTAESVIKTYALDRMSNLCILPDTFESGTGFDPNEYFRHSFGIVVSDGKVHNIVLKVEPRQAKYFRALPLHASQQEYIHDAYSIFHYRMRITDDFVSELLSHAPDVTVLEPPELRLKIIDRLKQAISRYEERQ